MRFPVSLSLIVVALGLTASRASAQAPRSACKDGTTTTVVGRGACSRHGGVDAEATKHLVKAETKAEVKTQKAEAKVVKAESKAVKTEDKMLRERTGATAQCKDGTYWHAKNTRGACTGHRGVARLYKS
ncbi:MAG TPA: DUF3761 domain-containing protein [Gemmatimonadaceae bacterium]